MNEKEKKNIVRVVATAYYILPIKARIIRLYVLGYKDHPSLRWELHYIIDKKCEKNNNNNSAPTPSGQ